VAALMKHAGRHGRSLLDACVVNSGSLLTRAVRDYRSRKAGPVDNDIDMIRELGVRVVSADLVRGAGRRVPGSGAPAKIRHDPAALGAVAMELAREGRKKRA
jgi:hypothetical protein